MADEKGTRTTRPARRGYRKRIEESMAQAEVERKRALMKKRIELARQGVSQYENNRIVEAVLSFKTYLKILESVKGVPDGGLQPSHFDVTTDMSELLLISGVYWDLMKIYDKTSSEGKLAEFRAYTEKYIIFSRGMPFQAVCAETLRKYIGSGKPNHKAEFKNAYKMLGKSKCYIATALYDVSEPETLEILRAYRDHRLEKTLGGRVLTQIYYAMGPNLAQITNQLPAGMRKVLGRILDQLALFLAKNISDTIGSEDELAIRKVKPE